MKTYKHCLLLYRLYNSNGPSDDWKDLNEQQNFNNRQDKVKIIGKSNFRIGKKLVDRKTIVNGMIKFEWLNLSFSSYIVGSRGASQLGGIF